MAAYLFFIIFALLINAWLGFVVTIVLQDLDLFINCKRKWLFLTLWPVANACSFVKCKGKKYEKAYCGICSSFNSCTN